jgi:hypothetical protein
LGELDEVLLGLPVALGEVEFPPVVPEAVELATGGEVDPGKVELVAVSVGLVAVVVAAGSVVLVTAVGLEVPTEVELVVVVVS